MQNWSKSVILEHVHVRLEPLSMNHLAGLCAVGLDESLWENTITRITTREEMRLYIEEALNVQERGLALPFAIIDRSSGAVAGSTRFGNIDWKNRRVEIGWTWLGLKWQRTALNTEAKYLLLRYAFEVLGCVRVELKTGTNNLRSRRAIERIGAQLEGVLRRHMITPGGMFRDTVYYSILDSEWDRIRSNLETRMKLPGNDKVVQNNG